MSVAEVLTGLIEKYGGNKTKIAAKLGVNSKGKPFCSSQKLGHYAEGKYSPKGEFFKRWKAEYGDDIERMAERNVSHETNRETLKHSFNTEVIKEAINQSMLEQLYKDLANFDKELDRAWALIDRLTPPAQRVKGVATKDR
jgi:hypothetical protein